MCGIIGTFHYSAPLSEEATQEIGNARDTMKTRGPNAAGLWHSPDQRVLFGHRRLAVIDLDTAANQPFSDPTRRYTIVYNGEVYNYHSLKKQLEAKGYVFRTHSDTEVVLTLYKDQGVDAFKQLRGMFALAIWDEQAQRLILARDHFGIKPLYYTSTPNQFYFSSQVRALKAFKAIDLSMEPAGHVGFFLFGSVPEPYTLYKNIFSLPAGSYMIVKKDQFSIQSYFNLPKTIAEIEQTDYSTRTLKQHHATLKETIEQSIKAHLIADVPTGAFLSAGLDSTLICHLANQHHSHLNTFTLGFADYKNRPEDETRIAEATAKKIGTTHKTYWVSKAEAKSLTADWLAHMDQPTIDGINTYFVSRYAAASGLTVALSGLGGDEILAGYNTFNQIDFITRYFGWARYTKKVNMLCRHWLSKLNDKLPSHKLASLLEYADTTSRAYFLIRALNLPWQLNHFLSPEIIQVGLEKLALQLHLNQSIAGIRNKTLQITALEMQWYMKNQLLRDTDWASMAHALEIRVPLVDIEVFKAAMICQRIKTQNKKQYMKQCLPESYNALLKRKKTGFNVPIRQWLLNKNASMPTWSQFIYHHFTQPEALAPIDDSLE